MILIILIMIGTLAYFVGLKNTSSKTKQKLLLFAGHSNIIWDVQCHPTEPSLFMSCSQVSYQCVCVHACMWIWDVQCHPSA